MNMKVAVLGCGNMAQAIVLGAARKISGIQFYTYTPSKTRALELAKKVKGQAVEELSELPQCDYYLLACKPQQIDELARELTPLLPSDAILISILAGVKTRSLQEKFSQQKIVRVMPNTPALVGEGVHALYFDKSVEEKHRDHISEIFQSIGEVFIFEDEEKIDIITGFSGSGPAYLFEIARIMTEKLEGMGIEKEMASRMIKATLAGSAKLLKESEKDAASLRNDVTSKKGVTYEALEVLKRNDLEGIFDKALDAAYNRSKELAVGK